MSDAQVIVPRRNFLVRALGFTAAGGATMTAADARARAVQRSRQRIGGSSRRIEGSVKP